MALITDQLWSSLCMDRTDFGGKGELNAKSCQYRKLEVRLVCPEILNSKEIEGEEMTNKLLHSAVEETIST